MSSAGSVTDWIGRLKAGDPEAARQLAERYLRRLVGLARRQLPHAPLALGDEEDVAQEAFALFVDGAARGQFPQLFDRNDLWILLALLTSRKAVDLLRREGRQKPYSPSAPQKFVSDLPPASDPEADVEQCLDPRLSPDEEALMDDQCRWLLECLGDPMLRSVAVSKLEGYTNEEIGAMLGCSLRSVERKVRLIRSIWQKEGKA
jgi:RNA polymerase sigma factor (sigma-70 family)